MPSREASRRNLQLATARRRKGLPRRLRCEQESPLIAGIVWHWCLADSRKRCSGRELARRIGVSHTWIQRLTRILAEDSEKVPRWERIYGPATFERLRKAQEQTRQDREREYLRRLPSGKWKEYKVGSNTVRWFARIERPEPRGPDNVCADSLTVFKKASGVDGGPRRRVPD